MLETRVAKRLVAINRIYARARRLMPLLMGFVEPVQCVPQRCEEPCEQRERDDAWPAAAVCGCFLLLVLLGWTLYFWP